MAAIYAHDAGHHVELWERTGRLGGNARYACKPFFKRDMHSMLRYFERELGQRGIPVRYYTEAEKPEAAAFKPDHIIWAAGGRPILPASIPGLTLPNVYPAVHALDDLCDVGDRVMVVGGGLVGVECALQMDMWGRQVSCIDMAGSIPSEPGFKMNDMLMKRYMEKSNVSFMSGTRLKQIEKEGLGCRVTVESRGEEHSMYCDTVLLALGFLPTADQAEPFKAIAPVSIIGDSREPRKILYAVEEAYEAVRGLA